MGRRAAGEASIRQRANGRWEARRTIGSRESAEVLSASGGSRAEALERLAAKVREHRRRLDLDSAADWTMPEFLAWWVDEELAARVQDGTLAPTTRQSYEIACRLHIAPALERVRLVDIKAAHVRRMLNDLAAAGLSATHRRYLHTVLRAALTDAIRYEYLERVNPVSLVSPPTVERSRKQPRSVADARRLLAAAAGTRLEAYWRVMLSAPLRPGEPLGADWDAFDVDAGMYRLRRNLVRHQGEWLWRPTKGKQARDVPLPAVTIETLRRHRAAMAAERLEVGTGWTGAQLRDVDGSTVRPWLAFTYPDGSPLHQTWLQRELGRLCDAAGIERLTPHGLRSVAVTLLNELGVHPRVIQQAAGHADLSTSDIYTGALDAQMRDAVDRLAAALE